jgi:hypothetical protein
MRAPEARTVSCPVCGHANRAGRKFCVECGAALGEIDALDAALTRFEQLCANQEEPA